MGKVEVFPILLLYFVSNTTIFSYQGYGGHPRWKREAEAEAEPEAKSHYGHHYGYPKPLCHVVTKPVCHKVPVKTPKQVPVPHCKKVPQVHCHEVLKEVHDE